MPDLETFLIEVYLLADAYCTTDYVPKRRPGPAPTLWPSEVLTLALCSQWSRFRSERDFYRFADQCLRPLFPTLPSRPQFNRQCRAHQHLITGFALWLADHQAAATAAYEVLDGTACPTRNAKRRGRGWLAGMADIGLSTRLGWYHGLRLLVGVRPDGTVTGWGVGPASSNDRALAETFFAVRAARRAAPRPGVPRLPSIGTAASDVYVADTGFAGRDCEARWVAQFHAQVVAPPQPDATRAWSPADRRRLAGWRQIVESVFDRLLTPFRLASERPHTLDGFLTRLAAKMGLHNVCLWLNRQHGQPALALAELPGW